MHLLHAKVFYMHLLHALHRNKFSYYIEKLTLRKYLNGIETFSNGLAKCFLFSTGKIGSA